MPAQVFLFQGARGIILFQEWLAAVARSCSLFLASGWSPPLGESFSGTDATHHFRNRADIALRARPGFVALRTKEQVNSFIASTSVQDFLASDPEAITAAA
jgi:hypothetical protein